MTNHRQGRVRQEILKIVNQTLIREIKDPRIDGVTITDIDLTGDLQQATIYYSSLDSDQDKRDDIQAGLDAATGVIRRELGHHLTLYKTPELKFERDPSVDEGAKIDALLRQIQKDAE